jgi:uncharacterized protein YkvS
VDCNFGLVEKVYPKSTITDLTYITDVEMKKKTLKLHWSSENGSGGEMQQGA